jgi:hypothetical protein
MVHHVSDSTAHKTAFEQTFYFGEEEKYPTRIVTYDVIVDDFRLSDVSKYYKIFNRQ